MMLVLMLTVGMAIGAVVDNAAYFESWQSRFALAFIVQGFVLLAYALGRVSVRKTSTSGVDKVLP